MERITPPREEYINGRRRDSQCKQWKKVPQASQCSTAKIQPCHSIEICEGRAVQPQYAEDKNAKD